MGLKLVKRSQRAVLSCLQDGSLYFDNLVFVYFNFSKTVYSKLVKQSLLPFSPYSNAIQWPTYFNWGKLFCFRFGVLHVELVCRICTLCTLCTLCTVCKVYVTCDLTHLVTEMMLTGCYNVHRFLTLEARIEVWLWLKL